MSLSFRHHAGLALAGMVIAAPLLGAVLLEASAAYAATATITFTGQPLTAGALSCPSAPSETTLTVITGTTVNFVNRTGRQATLWAGEAEKSIPDQSLVPVTFNGAPATVVVQMLPDCPLDLGRHVQMTVNVVAADGTAPVPTTASTLAAGATKSGTVPGATNPTPNDNIPFTKVPTVTDVSKPIIGPAVRTTGSRSASGLLTLIATVGVVGVSAAAIRAIVAQRSTRLTSA